MSLSHGSPGLVLPPPPVLPAAVRLMLRPEKQSDLPFLKRLYRASRQQEMLSAGMDPIAMRPFLDQQFDLQRQHYRRHYHDGGLFLILEHRHQPQGRLYLHHSPQDIRIVDISLLTDVRGQGWGGLLLQAVQAQAQARMAGVSLSVFAHNPAARLYQRLGFVITGSSSDGRYEMRWSAAPPAGTVSSV